MLNDNELTLADRILAMAISKLLASSAAWIQSHLCLAMNQRRGRVIQPLYNIHILCDSSTVRIFNNYFAFSDIRWKNILYT